jgi:hypothetical protein
MIFAMPSPIPGIQGSTTNNQLKPQMIKHQIAKNKITKKRTISKK